MGAFTYNLDRQPNPTHLGGGDLDHLGLSRSTTMPVEAEVVVGLVGEDRVEFGCDLSTHRANPVPDTTRPGWPPLTQPRRWRLGAGAGHEQELARP